MSLSSKTELARALFRSTPPDSVTRISGTATADSSDGTVTVQLEDGDVIEVGTIGSVSAGDTVTIHVQRGEAQVIASEGWGDAMQAAVDEAQAIAEATGQHFWHDSNGAHVTEITQEQWQQSQTGHNILVNSLGILLRKALNYIAAWTGSALSFYDGNGNAASNVTASFGSAGAQIGKVDESHLEMDYHSLRLIDKDGDTYLHVSDLRDQSGTAEVEEQWIGNGTRTSFSLTYTASDTNYTVTVNGSAVTPTTRDDDYFTLSTAPANGEVVVAEYKTADAIQAFTFGSRMSGSKIGARSFSEGDRNIASGANSHAEGRFTIASGANSHAEGVSNEASGLCSHAEGNSSHAVGYAAHAEGWTCYANGTASHAGGYGTKADGQYQTVIGRTNATDTTSALIIGNGVNELGRRNALTVDWSGNVWAAGDVDAAGDVYCTDVHCTDVSATGDVTASGDVSGATLSSAGGLSLGTIDFIECGLTANTAAGTTATWTYVDVKLNSVVRSYGSGLSLATSGADRYGVVVSKDGYYRISGYANVNAPSYVAVTVDGTTVSNIVFIQSGYNGAGFGSTVVKLTSGSVIKMRIERTGATDPTVGGTTLTKLTVERVG